MIPGKFHLRWLIRWLLRLLSVGVGALLLLMVHITYQFGGGDSSTLPVDCVIVFGAAVHYGNEAGPGIYRRVETAANLYHEGNVHTIFLTGGKGSEKQDSEALVMQRLAMRMGVDPDDLVLEDKATSTWENLLYTRGLVEECSSIVGISDRYHLARIQYLAALQGWGDFRTLPATTIPPFQFEVRAVAREAFGLVYYTLSQYIDVEKYITPVSR